MYRSTSSHYDDSMNNNWMHRDVFSLHCYDRNRYEPHGYEPHRFDLNPMQGPSTTKRETSGPYHTESWRRGPYGTSEGRYQDSNSPVARHHSYDYYPGDPRYHQEYNQAVFVPRDLIPNGQYLSPRPPHGFPHNRLNEPNQFSRRFKDDDRFSRNRKFDTRRTFKTRKNKQSKKEERDHALNSTLELEKDSTQSYFPNDQIQLTAGTSSKFLPSNESLMNTNVPTESSVVYVKKHSANCDRNGDEVEGSHELSSKMYNNSEILGSQDETLQACIKDDISAKKIDLDDTEAVKDESTCFTSDISDLDEEWREIIDLVDGKIKPSDIINSGNRSGNDIRDMYRTY